MTRKHSPCICVRCGVKFTAKRAHQKLCGPECRRLWCDQKFNAWLSPREKAKV